MPLRIQPFFPGTTGRSPIRHAARPSPSSRSNCNARSGEPGPPDGLSAPTRAANANSHDGADRFLKVSDVYAIRARAAGCEQPGAESQVHAPLTLLIAPSTPITTDAVTQPVVSPRTTACPRPACRSQPT